MLPDPSTLGQVTAPATATTLLGLTEGDAFLLIAVVALPIAALAFALVGPALRQLGKGRFSVEFEQDLPQSALTDSPAASAAEREQEIRQMVEAKAFRQAARGEHPLDVEVEIGRLMSEASPAGTAADAGLVDEVRQLVVARNQRRERRGEPPLDVESEVERQLREFENLGQ